LINKKLQEHYKERPSSYKLPELTLANITASNGWAELSSSAIKSAPTKAAAPFFASLARQYYPSASQLDTAIRQCCDNLVASYDIIRDATMFPNDVELTRLRDATDEFGIGLQTLRGVSSIEGQLLWQVRPKAHKAMHTPFFAQVISPSAVNCYINESQIGTSQQVWRASAKGKYHASIQRTMLAKRWLALLLRFESDR